MEADTARDEAVRIRATQACEPCRRLRIKCSGAHPCHQCAARAKPSQCYYAAPRKRGPKTGSRRSASSSSSSSPSGAAPAPPLLSNGSSSTPLVLPMVGIPPTHPLYHHQQHYPQQTRSPSAPWSIPLTAPMPPCSPSMGAGTGSLATSPFAPTVAADSEHHPDSPGIGTPPGPTGNGSSNNGLTHHSDPSPMSPSSPSSLAAAMGATAASSAANDSTAANTTPNGGSNTSTAAAVAVAAARDAMARSREPTRDEVADLADTFSVMVSLDIHGRTSGVYSLGDSSGIHLIRKVSRRAVTGPNGGYVNAAFQLVDELAVPRYMAKFLRTWPTFADHGLVDMLVEYYYAELHSWLPFLPRSWIEGQLDTVRVFRDAAARGCDPPPEPSGAPARPPNLLLVNSFLTYASTMFERHYKLVERHSGGLRAPPGMPQFPVSRALAFHAKRELALHLEACSTSIEAVQACLLLTLVDTSLIVANPWLMGGMAVRIALELGLHQAHMFRHLGGDARHVVGDLVVYTKTWIAVYTIEQTYSTMFGRPSIASSGEVHLSIDLAMDTPENRLMFPHAELEPMDSPFIWFAKLMDIAGRTTRLINDYYHRRRLQDTLPELHAMLIGFQESLPESLKYAPRADGSRPSIQVAAIHIAFYSAVLSLYRPFLASPYLRSDGELQAQYIEIVQQCVIAIPTILLEQKDQLGKYPFDVSQDLLYIQAGLVAMFEESRTLERRRVVLSVLQMCARITEIIAQHLPDWAGMMRLHTTEFIQQVADGGDAMIDDLQHDMMVTIARIVGAEKAAITACGGDDRGVELMRVREAADATVVELRRVVGDPAARAAVAAAAALASPSGGGLAAAVGPVGVPTRLLPPDLFPSAPTAAAAAPPPPPPPQQQQQQYMPPPPSSSWPPQQQQPLEAPALPLDLAAFLMHPTSATDLPSILPMATLALPMFPADLFDVNAAALPHTPAPPHPPPPSLPYLPPGSSTSSLYSVLSAGSSVAAGGGPGGMYDFGTWSGAGMQQQQFQQPQQQQQQQQYQPTPPSPYRSMGHAVPAGHWPFFAQFGGNP
ncbi:hypothetical protein BC828DRAFT_417251 [Blastocladiella britannica]|nr:hypothetical protein BC828DRAFT_417251 [Blastocladiella britannica]